MSEWTLEDAPEYFRAEAHDSLKDTLHCFGNFLRCLTDPREDAFTTRRFDHGTGTDWHMWMLENAEDAEYYATRYHDAKRAVSELRTTLSYFQAVCTGLCSSSRPWGLDIVAIDHRDMLREPRDA